MVASWPPWTASSHWRTRLTAEREGRAVKKRLIPVVALVALAMAAPVKAAPIEWEHYSGTDSFDFSDCGFVIHDEGHA